MECIFEILPPESDNGDDNIAQRFLDEIEAATDYASLSESARKYLYYYIQEHAIKDKKCFLVLQALIGLWKTKNIDIPKAFTLPVPTETIYQ